MMTQAPHAGVARYMMRRSGFRDRRVWRWVDNSPPSRAIQPSDHLERLGLMRKLDRFVSSGPPPHPCRRFERERRSIGEDAQDARQRACQARATRPASRAACLEYRATGTRPATRLGRDEESQDRGKDGDANDQVGPLNSLERLKRSGIQILQLSHSSLQSPVLHLGTLADPPQPRNSPRDAGRPTKSAQALPFRESLSAPARRIPACVLTLEPANKAVIFFWGSGPRILSVQLALLSPWRSDSFSNPVLPIVRSSPC
jgi:hypothetical protein